eukprot:3026043-Amphidinium_carterae.1
MTTTAAISQSTCLRGRRQSKRSGRTVTQLPMHTAQFTFAVPRTSQSSSIQTSMDKTQWTSI